MQIWRFLSFLDSLSPFHHLSNSLFQSDESDYLSSYPTSKINEIASWTDDVILPNTFLDLFCRSYMSLNSHMKEEIYVSYISQVHPTR